MIKRMLLAALALSLTVPAFAWEEEKSSFSDVPATHWAFSAVVQAEKEDIISGMGDGTFAPDSPLTAAQFSAIMTQAFYWRALREAESEPDQPWFVPFQETAEEAGLMEGTGVEDWDAPMTRYQMARMLYNIVTDKEITPDDTASPYAIADLDQIPEKYREAVKSVYSLGLLSGTDESGTFAGEWNLTRAQAAAVFVRLDEAMKSKAGPMEWALEKAERFYTRSFLSTTFRRHPGPKGTVYVVRQGGGPHGPVTFMAYVYPDGRVLDINSLLPDSYRLSDTGGYLDPTEIQFDGAGNKLTFVTPIEEGVPNQSPGPENPDMWAECKDWGPTRCTVDLTAGTMERMEPLTSQTRQDVP